LGPGSRLACGHRLNDLVALWMRFAGLGYFGRIATWLTHGSLHLTRNAPFADYNSQDISRPVQLSIIICNSALMFSLACCYLQVKNSGSVEVGDRAAHSDTCIETGDGGSLKIGSDTHIQPRCQFSAYKAPIQIGCGVQIAPNCAFYPTIMALHLN